MLFTMTVNAKFTKTKISKVIVNLFALNADMYACFPEHCHERNDNKHHSSTQEHNPEAENKAHEVLNTNIWIIIFIISFLTCKLESVVMKMDKLVIKTSTIFY